MHNGVVNIIKPSGVSSAYVVSLVKRKFRGEKVGHFGTLDPNATGVLPIAVGKATRLFNHFLNKDKIYYAVFSFGKETDTLDSEGEIIKTSQVIPTEKELTENCKKLTGVILQKPPQYSAKKVNGEKAYNLARKGIEFELKSKEITVYSFELLKRINENSFQFKIHCSSGTYIRSLCRDLAYLSNSVAYMPELVRTKAGNFTIENAISVEDFNADNYSLMSIDELLIDMPKIELDKVICEKLINGIKIPFDTSFDSFTVYCNNTLIGIGKVENDFLKIETYLRS